MSYCSAIEAMQPEEKKALHKNYHDHYYGFPIHDDNELFGRLILEINQAGLSWEIILKRNHHSEKHLMILAFKKLPLMTKKTGSGL